MAHPKGILIDSCKRLGLPKPNFDTKSTGPDHEPTFITDVVVGGQVYGTGQGNNKRESEKHASEEALAHLERLEVEAAAREPVRPAAPKRAPATTQSPSPGDNGFEGPWPIFPELLSASLTVANSRVNGRLQGSEAMAEVQALALNLYKGSLESLGEIVEVDEED